MCKQTNKFKCVIIANISYKKLMLLNVKKIATSWLDLEEFRRGKTRFTVTTWLDMKVTYMCSTVTV